MGPPVIGAWSGPEGAAGAPYGAAFGHAGAAGIVGAVTVGAAGIAGIAGAAPIAGAVPIAGTPAADSDASVAPCTRSGPWRLKYQFVWTCAGDIALG